MQSPIRDEETARGRSSARKSGGGADKNGTNAPAHPDETLSPNELCEREGLDIRRVEYVESASEIEGQDHTLYLVSGTIEGRWFDSVTDVAIVGESGADAAVRTETRDWDFCVVGDADGFLLANLTFDQTADGAWFRVNAPGDGVTIRNIDTLGSGRRANPTPNEPLDEKSGPTYFIPATSEDATNKLVNVELTHDGVFPKQHFGDRESGLWTGRSHRGTIRVVDSLFRGVVNNPIYGSASPGSFEVVGCKFVDNGVTCGGRFAHGFFKDCIISFDHERSNMAHDDQPEHGVVGLASEAKKAGATGEAGPDILNTTIRMINVGSGGAAARAYDIYQPSDFGRIEDSEFHIEKGTGGYDADIEVEGGVETIKDCTFTGSNDEYASIVNTSGERVVLEGCKWAYPAPRRRSKGHPVDWR
jgi:hypothetical protein